MTNEEASKIIYKEWQKFLEHNIDYAGISEAYKLAIKALEQTQPKDGDRAVSLNDVLCAIHSAEMEAESEVSFKNLLQKYIKQLPSVSQPQIHDKRFITSEELNKEVDKIIKRV